MGKEIFSKSSVNFTTTGKDDKNVINPAPGRDSPVVSVQDGNYFYVQGVNYEYGLNGCQIDKNLAQQMYQKAILMGCTRGQDALEELQQGENKLKRMRRFINKNSKNIKKKNNGNDYDINKEQPVIEGEIQKMSTELIKNIVELFTGDDLVCMLQKLEINKINGFRSVSTLIPVQILQDALRNAITNKAHEKVTDLKSQDEYINLYEEDKYKFYIQILYDLYNNKNLDLLKDILQKEPIKSQLTLDQDEGSQQLEGLQTKLDELEEELQDKNTCLKKLERAHRKDLENKEKKYGDLNKQYHTAVNKAACLEDKLAEEVKEHQKTKEDLEALSQKFGDLVGQMAKLEQDLQYYRFVAQKKHILLVNLHPEEPEQLPYHFVEITLEQLQQEKLPDPPITEVWLARENYNLFAYNQLLTKLSAAYGEINVTDIDAALAGELKIEVLKC